MANDGEIISTAEIGDGDGGGGVHEGSKDIDEPNPDGPTGPGNAPGNGPGAGSGAGGEEGNSADAGGNSSSSSGKIIVGKSIDVNNVRAIICESNVRKVWFTPVSNGKISIRLLEAGADTDYDVPIVKSDIGELHNGAVVLDVKAGARCGLTVELAEKFIGALKVMANEI